LTLHLPRWYGYPIARLADESPIELRVVARENHISLRAANDSVLRGSPGRIQFTISDNLK
jgi:hypothetical protein